MDENEKKDNLPEENGEISENSAEEIETNEAPLTEEEANELEHLVKAAKAKSEEEILKKNVQDWDGLIDESEQEAEGFVLEESEAVSDEAIEKIEAPVFDEDDERLCSICHRRLKLTENGVEYEYCKRCRNELLDTRYNWKSVVTFILSCVFVVCAVAFSAMALINGMSVGYANKLVKENKDLSAYNIYSGLVDTEKSDYQDFWSSVFSLDVGTTAKKNFIKLQYNMGNVQYLGTTIEACFDEKELAKSENADIKAIYDDYQKIFTTVQAVSSELNELGDDSTREDLLEVEKALEGYKKNADYDKAFVSYYQYYACMYVEGTEDLQEKYLNEIKKERPDAKWLYDLSFAQLNLNQKDYDKTIKIAEECLAENAEDFDAYRFIIISLRLQGKYDEALKVCDEALKTASDVKIPSSEETTSTADVLFGSNIYLEQAIINGIKGDMKTSQAAVDKYYEGANSNGNLTLEGVYLYAMINKANGNEDAYSQAEEMLSSNGYSFPENVQKFLDGKIQLKDVFEVGKADWYR